MIVFDASTVVSAALKVDSVPERALLRADEIDVFALSTAVDAEIAGVLNRPKFAGVIRADRRAFVLNVLRREAAWFDASSPTGMPARPVSSAASRWTRLSNGWGTCRRF